MIIALLILIVFILLFGATAVKGWIKHTGALALGLVIIIGLVLWVGSFFGEDGPANALLVIGGFVIAMALWTTWHEASAHHGARRPPADPELTFHSRRLSREEKKILRERYRERQRRD